jgi:uncharacterized protein with PIN domain
MRSADGVRFLADSNVGRLARWLRVLGYDAAFEPRLSDGLLVFRALREGRVLLTRDVELTRRRLITTGQVEAVLLTGDQVQDQLRQVRQELDLDDGAAMSRCLECNVPLQPRDPAAVAHRVPPYVRATQRRFSECPRCARVYWPGTHWERMRAQLQRAP